MLELNQIYNMDCKDGMKQIPDKYFELAVVDPPYFSGPERREYFGRKVSPIGVKRYYKKCSSWQVPKKDYFDELLRISKNQIIWGINYFDINLGSGRIVWDKVNGTSSFSDCEIAYCSLHDSVRLFVYMWNGMMQGKSITEGRVQQGNKSLNEKRICITQKPVFLYKWLFNKYANEGDKILDTHMGSGSSIIACHDMGFNYMAFEIDKYMYSKAVERIEKHKDQIRMVF